MTNHTLKLTDKEVLNQAHEGLKAHLPVQADGYKCSTDQLLDLLLGIAANSNTLETVCNDLELGFNAETARGYLNRELRVEDLPVLEEAMNQAMVDQVPQAVLKKAQQVAMDFHDRPYYGKQAQESGKWVQGKLKQSTHRFYRVATAYVIRRGLRVTLAIHLVLPGESPLHVLQALLDRLQELKVDLTVLYLDKGFAGIEVLDYLTRQHIPSLIACSIRGKQGGTKALCTGKRSYLTPHTFHGRGGKSFTGQLAVCRVFTTNKRKGRSQRRAEWLIFILVEVNYSPLQAKGQYQQRFGIETSYRCSGQVRGWTTSPNPAYRFVLISIAFYLLNVWLHLRWLFTQEAHRGRRRLQVQRFRLYRLAKFIVRALEDQYGCVHEIAAPDPPLP